MLCSFSTEYITSKSEKAQTCMFMSTQATGTSSLGTSSTYKATPFKVGGVSLRGGLDCVVKDEARSPIGERRHLKSRYFEKSVDIALLFAKVREDEMQLRVQLIIARHCSEMVMDFHRCKSPVYHVKQRELNILGADLRGTTAFKDAESSYSMAASKQRINNGSTRDVLGTTSPAETKYDDWGFSVRGDGLMDVMFLADLQRTVGHQSCLSPLPTCHIYTMYRPVMPISPAIAPILQYHLLLQDRIRFRSANAAGRSRAVNDTWSPSTIPWLNKYTPMTVQSSGLNETIAFEDAESFCRTTALKRRIDYWSPTEILCGTTAAEAKYVTWRFSIRADGVMTAMYLGDVQRTIGVQGR
ncbi:hypothetical protein HWV62_22361 [Athelia sp. TMB]|nr:hypothetical protein HWV62_22361 [Athelia sp. TMB]